MYDRFPDDLGLKVQIVEEMLLASSGRKFGLRRKRPAPSHSTTKQSLRQISKARLTREEEQIYCRILQDAKLFQDTSSRISAKRQGHVSTLAEVCASVGLSDVDYARFVLATAPKAQQALSKAFKRYIAKQARLLVGSSVSVQSTSDPLTRPSQSKEGKYGKFTQQMDDLMLAGMEGLMQAVYRFQTSKTEVREGQSLNRGGAPAGQLVVINDGRMCNHTGRETTTWSTDVKVREVMQDADASQGNQGTEMAVDPLSSVEGIRLITFAHFYIQKYIIAAIKEASFNQVYIPRRTLDLKRKVQEAASIHREADGRPDVAAIARSLKVSESAIRDVLLVQSSSHVVSLEPGGSESNPYEDVHLARELDRFQCSSLEGSSSSASVRGGTTDSLEVAGGKASAEGKGVAHGPSSRGDAEREVASSVARHLLDSLLRGIMKEKEALVLMKTMGLGRNQLKGVSSYVVAEEMGMSRQGVDRLKAKALEKLRCACQEDVQLAQLLQEVCEELS
ncbi:hypothetical protein CEUSTIGMA_g8259.t1 [Chlamydomonas eustigma]|uniref:Uncharacterized protein n=1 Tax=Chlamydomonas eustigma TaxID=1157962 RepID=A0A250XCP1_9CHLO|nr:hypothetical protein CEUSTIGMA_g8259.t1 [Chlamydomonas eustigma]|eukprot:GAX80824.1 hypothetical protein CEUSTIGMA_g8259.t1 [Chlamydomonas eustigma]